MEKNKKIVKVVAQLLQGAAPVRDKKPIPVVKRAARLRREKSRLEWYW